MAAVCPQNLHSLFLTAAEQNRSKCAVVVDNGESTTVIKYSELAAQSKWLAEELRTAGRKNNEVIAVLCSSFDEVIVAVLGILQVPACFMYLSPKDPARRTLQLLSGVQVTCLISTDELSHTVAEMLKTSFIVTAKKLPSANVGNGTVYTIFHLQAALPSTTSVPSKGLLPLAYVVFTSGSTGTPKIVKVPHQCILPNILHLRELFKISSSDVIFNASPLTFDPSIVEIFLTLSCGATLISVSDEMKLVPGRFVSALTKHKVSIVQATPSFVCRIPLPLIKACILSRDSTVRILAFGGEPCPTLSTLAKWRDDKNKTEIFNLYGITEVSCWASCHYLGGKPATTSELRVSLGIPLRETVLEVRNENGCTLTEGQGQLFIGSKTRICYIDDVVCSGCDLVFRATGDYVEITQAGLMFLGRKDDQFKRFGKRFSLKEVTKALEHFPEVSSCRAILDKSQSPARLFVFYIPTHGTTKDGQIKITDECKLLKVKLREFLPDQGLPDFIFRVQTYPVTSHGKVDSDSLKRLGNQYLKDRLTSAETSVEGFIKEILDMPHTYQLDRRKSFIELGGNSLQAVRLVEQLEFYFSDKYSELLDSLLHYSLDEVFEQLVERGSDFTVERVIVTAGDINEDKFPSDSKIYTQISQTRETKKFSSESSAINDGEFQIFQAGSIFESNVESKEKLLNEDDKAVFAYKVKEEADNEGDSIHSNRENMIHLKTQTFGGDDDSKYQSLKRCKEDGDVPETQECHNMVKKQKGKQPNDASPNVTVATRGMVLDVFIDLSLITSKVHKMTLEVKWQVDLKKCIDASPLIVFKEGYHSVVYIGSHSGLFAAIDSVTGQRLWQVQLPDRIESSACLTPCKKMVAVGCYDCKVYFFDQSSGRLQWVFPTLGPVKSSPAPDDVTGLVFVGSHDGCIYALNPLKKTCVWTVNEGGGSMFSSPCVDPLNDCVYAASLSGKLLCVGKESGEVRWSYTCQKPVFSSPTTTSKFVVVGSVDGGVYTLTHSGKLVHKVMTSAPVFSSPCVVSISGNDHILIGSHDGHLYCIDLQADGIIRWRKYLGRHVYSTPSCIFNNAVEHSFTKMATTETSTKRLNLESSSAIGKADVESLNPEKDRTLMTTSDDLKNLKGFICCCATDGKLEIIKLETGTEVASYQFPGEVFSSPVMTSFDQIIVGCRNNYVYQLSLV